MRIIYSLVLFVAPLLIISQTKPATYKDYFQEGSYLLLENNLEKAKENFELAYQLDSTNANINYMMGICYVQSPLQKSKAEYYLEKAVTDVSKTYRTDEPAEKSAAPLAHFYYGMALHINYKFNEALAQYELFRSFIDPKDKEYEKMLEKEVATAKLARDIVSHPINVQITNLGDSVNSIYPEYSPVLSADERMLIFTTRRSNSTGGLKNDDGAYFEDLVVAYKDDMDRWSSPRSLSPNVNGPSHEASINLTPDGQTLIVFKNDMESKNLEGDGNIYYSTFDGKDWSSLKEFGSDINTSYQESHACLSADGNVLFLSSERPGGFGGKDIYRCIKLPNGKWSKALNMGPLINTEFDEDGGFIHPDGQTFFFASNGPKSMGGYDIMFATLNEENKFSNVTNIGYPINTTDDDVFYVTSPDGKRGYFSSAKAGGFGEKDLYLITMAEARETFLALFKGQLIPSEGETLPENILIIVTDKQNNEIIGSYRPKLVNGTFSTILPPGKEYNFSYQTDDGEEFYNEDVFVSSEQTYQEIRRAVNLEPVRLSGKVKVKEKNLLLNTVVLNNNKSKKAVGAAKVILEEEGGSIQSFESRADGKYDGIVLQPEKNYKVYTESESKKSPPVEISTMGIKSAKIFNQVLYLEGKAEKFTSKELLLDVIVKNPKTKKTIQGVSVLLVDADGAKFQAITDAKGMARGIELSPELRYELMANKDGIVSEKATFTTGTIAEGKRIEQVLYIDYEAPKPTTTGTVATKTAISHTSEHVKELPDSEYEFYYKYGRRNVNENAETWINFVDRVATLSKERAVTVNIRSSASRVPSRGGNKNLAKARASRLENLLRNALTAKGADMSKVKFVKVSVVSGPKYRGDYRLGRKKYEKYQYVKAKLM